MNLQRLAALIVAAWALTALAVPFLALSPEAISLADILVPPAVEQPLGGDDLGRSVLDRLVIGARTSFWVAFGVVGLSLLFGTLIGSGVPILEALNISRDTAGNAVLASAIQNVHDSVREGDPIAAPLGQSRVCDDMVVNMIDVGEETGNLDEMLMRIADSYDEEVDSAVESMTSLMEPIMIVGLGAIVLFIVVSLFLPLITIMNKLQ